MVSTGISVKEVASAVTDTNPFMQSGSVDTKHKRTVVIVDDESTGRLILGKIIQQVADDITIVDFESPLEALGRYLSVSPSWYRQIVNHLFHHEGDPGCSECVFLQRAHLTLHLFYQ